LRSFTPRDYEAAAQIERLLIASDGMLVAACASDVITYDGLRFDRIETPIRKIRALAISKGGTHIYAGGDDQLGVIDRSPDGSWAYRSTLDEIPASARPLGRVTSIATVGEDVWIATETKLLRRRGRVNAVIPLDGSPFTLLPAKDEIYLHREGAGLFRMAADRLVPVTSDALASDGPAVGLFREEALLVLASSRHGLVRIEDGRARLFGAGLSGLAPVTAASRAAGGGYVLGTDDGLLVTDASGAIAHRVSREEGFPASAVTSLALDRDGSVWAGTPEGLVEISLLGAVSRFDARDGLPEAPVSAITRHGGRLVLAAEDGLYVLRPGAFDGTLPARFDKLPAPVARPTDLLVAGGSLLVSGSGGVWRLDSGSATRVLAVTGEVSDLAPWSADPDVILAAGTQGMSVLHREGERFTVVRAFTDLGDVRTIAEDPQGRLWLGTASRGVRRIDLGRGVRTAAWADARVTSFDAASGKFDEGDAAASVAVVAGDVLAIGPNHVHRYEAAADAFRRDDRFALDGTPLNRLWPVATSSAQRFWASASLDARRSDFPLARLERSAGGLWTLVPAPAPVLEGLGFAGASPIFLEAPGEDDEVVWAAGFGGLYRLRSSELAASSTRPSVAIVSASGGGRMRMITGTGREAKLAAKIPYSREPVRFGFGAASLLLGARIEYRWRLEGWNDGWSTWSASREAMFSSLPAGTYQFTVEARDRSGTSSHAASVAFGMAPPPWLAWWAWCGYGVLAACFVWAAMQVRVARAAEERRRLEGIVAERTDEAAQSREAAEEAERQKSRFLARMSGELKSPLDALLSLAQALEHDPQLATRYIDRIGALKASGSHLLTLLDEIVELTEVESGEATLRHEAFSVAALLRDVESSFVAQARERGLRFHVATRDLPRLPVNGDAARLRQVLENLIVGAMRLTERGEVRLTVIGEPRSGHVHFAVSDTGPGVTPDEPEWELGLAVSRRIVELMGASLETASQPGEGSTSHFSIRLPEAEEEPARPAVGRAWLEAARLASSESSRPPGA